MTLLSDSEEVQEPLSSLKSLSSLGFEGSNLGCPGNFAGMSRTHGGVRKVCAKKVRAHFSFPKIKFKILNFQARLKISSEPPTKEILEVESEISIEIEFFKRD